MTDDNEGVRLVIGVVDKWPWNRTQWRFFVYHPYRAARAVQLFLMVKLLRWMDKRGWAPHD